MRLTSRNKDVKLFGMSEKLKGVVRGLCSVYNVEVKFEGNSASTDGKTITVPFISPLASNDEVDKIVGYLYHEAGHILYSNMGAMNAQIKRIDTLVFCPSMDTNIMLNIVEDIRIETRMVNRNSNIARYLQCMNKPIVDKMASEKVANTIQSNIIMYMAYTHLGCNLDHVLWNNYITNEQSDYIDKYKVRVDTLLKEIKETCDRPVLIYYTIELIKLLLSDSKDKKQVENNKPSSSPKEDKDMQGGNGNIPLSTMDPAVVSEIKFMTDNAFSSKNKSILNNASVSNMGEYGQSDEHSHTSAFCNAKVLNSTQETSSQAALPLRKKLIKSLRGHKNKVTKRHQTEGIVDIRSAHKLYAGCSLAVFKNVRKHKAINTSIHLCVDASYSTGKGSTKGSISENIRVATLALHKALRRTNISMSTLAFTEDVRILHDFNKPLPDIEVEKITGGGVTLLGEALLVAGKRVSSQPVDRKIVIAITDGRVNQATREAHDVLIREHIEVYYILVSGKDGKKLSMPKNIPNEVCIAFTGDFTKDFLHSFTYLLEHKRLCKTQ